MKKIQVADFQKDKRHLICSGITLLSFLMGIFFPNSLPRLAEAFRDLATSMAFYVCELAAPDYNPIPDTINQLPALKLLPEFWKPVKIIPASWEEFITFWGMYISLILDWVNIQLYWQAISDFLFYGSRFLMLLVPVAAVILMFLSNSKDVTCTERGKKSPKLQKFERFLFRRVYPVKDWVKAFCVFLKENPGYTRSWMVLWALHFNLFSIVISLIGYYFYLVSSWDLLSIYTQLLKLQADLTPVIRFIPGIAWAVVFAKLYNKACRDAALSALYAAEDANMAVITQSSIITTLAGPPNAGKTKTLTSMALTAQVKQFDNAFKIMLTRAAQFPNFPWQIFRDYITMMVDSRVICDINQAKKHIASRRAMYDKITAQFTAKQLASVVRSDPEMQYYTFGYDYTHYSTTYNNELKIIHLYDALESYAAAFLVFSVETNLLFSNYSIRTDSLKETLGNLPLRDNDFFHRDPALQEVYSQHSHIIDYDILRLGKKFDENNKKANGAPFGVIVISEIDKEFKNQLQLKETKANVDEVNQKNDLHDAALMMIRHGVVIDYIPFVTVLADLQRPEAWGAGGRELGNIAYIVDRSPTSPTLPFFSTYWFTEWIFSWIKRKWDQFDTEYQYRRSDQTLPIYLIRNAMSKINNHYEKLKGLYGLEVVTLEIQSGRMDGETRLEKWRNPDKKLAFRYFTDCLASVFDKATPNTMHIDDFITYAGALATKEECALQNSYFQRDIHKIQENNK